MMHDDSVARSKHKCVPFRSFLISHNDYHRYRPRRRCYAHLYDRLRDGLHPGNLALEKIAAYLIRCLVGKYNTD